MGTVAALAGASLWARRLPVEWTPGNGAIHEGTLVARVVGEGSPESVLLHGLGGSSEYWGAEYEPLAMGGQLVIPDLLGFGRSPHPAEGYGLDAQADAVAACLVELGADRPLRVGAHSLGCLVALALAARHPDLVAEIVGFGPPLYADRDSARVRIAKLGFVERQMAYELPFAERCCLWMCDHPRAAARLGQFLRPGIPWPIVRAGVEHNWASYSQTFRDTLLAQSSALLVGGVKAPVVMVAGFADKIPDRSYLHLLASHHPNLRIVEREGGHDLPLTDPVWCLGQLLTPMCSPE